MSFTVGRGGGQKKNQGFLKINGKEIDPAHYNRIYDKLRSGYPNKLSPKEILYLQSMTISQTIDFTLMLNQAKREVKISGAELNRAIESIAKQQKLNSVDQLKRLLKRSGMKWNDFKKMVKDDILVQKLVTKKRNEIKVSPNDLREIRASHILIRHQKGKEKEVKTRIKNIYKRAKSGEDFSKLAKKYSEDPGSAKKDGDLGYFTTGAMVAQFEEAAFKLKLGEISQPVKTDFGYHIIKLLNTRLRKIKGEKDVEKAILLDKQQKYFSNWMYSIKKDTKIEMLDPSLRALDLRLKGKLNEASYEYQKAINLNPTNAYLHVFLGDLYEELKKDDLAILEYKKAISITSGDPTLYILLGDLYQKNKKRSLAIEQYKKASLIAGDFKAIHEELVSKFKKVGATSSVRAELAEIARIDKKQAFEKSLREKERKLVTE